jgi:hypothetical protein
MSPRRSSDVSPRRQTTPGRQNHAGAQIRGHFRNQPIHLGRGQDVDIAAALGLHRRADPARVGIEDFVLDGSGTNRVQQRESVRVAGRMPST